MDYQQLVQQALCDLGINATVKYNTLQPPWTEQGWQLHLPPLDHNQWLLLHFQDRVTGTPQGCVELQQIEQHYGAAANRVAVLCYAHGMRDIYQGPVKIIDFSSHNWLTVHDLIQRADLWQSQLPGQHTQAWQCLNGKIMPHRYRVANVLRSWPNGTLSLGQEIALPDWPYTTYFGTENYDNFLRLLPLYQRTAVNIVSESEYDARPGVISEKTLFAFVAGQIPIVIGHAGAVSDCANMGFDMFSDLVDTSYDWLPNDQRIEQALWLNRALILGQIDLAPYAHRVRHNQHWAINGFVTWMRNRLITDLGQLLA